MPKLILRIPETELSVTRPVVMEVARKLFKQLGIHPNTQVYFPLDGIDKRAQAGSVMGSTERDEANYLPFSQSIRIEALEEYEEDSLGATAIHRPENFPFFRDDKLGIMLKPAYSNTDVTLNFKFRAADRTIAKRWRDEVRMRYSDQREVYAHSASFHWQPPVAFMNILGELHRLRENVLPYGEDFDTYFDNGSDARLSKLVTQAGTDGTWEVSETQGDLYGYFDFTGGPEAGSKEDDGDTWTISFSYKFRYFKPLACVMHYPLSVHNQILDQKWRPSPQDDIAKVPARSAGLSTAAFFQFRSDRPRAFASINGYGIPAFDEFIPGSVVPETRRLFTALMQLDLNDRQALLNLTQLGKIKFTPLITNFLKVEAPYMAKTYNSVFCLSLYEEVGLHRSGLMTVDSELNVRSVNELDPRKVYHVRLALVTDWALLTPPAIDRLTENGEAALELIKVIDPRFTDNANGLLPVLNGRGQITKPAIRDVIDEINKGTHNPGGGPPGANGLYNGQHVGHNTVGTIFIETFKEQ